ncbi:MAG: hypothetical protein Q8R67_02260 [Rhodoferax sp.]|nr:hypothetical protein [Rhodoferax sp.]MDP3650484.1 hypothetical protein [Rhodoferax sp.]
MNFLQSSPARSTLQTTLFVALLVLTMSGRVSAQSSELDSDELMRRIVSISADPDFRRGSPEKRSLYETHLQELMNRAKARQPSAMFNFGWYRNQFCVITKKQGIDVTTAPMCVEAVEDLRAVAENPKIASLFISPAAMTMLGEMHRDGIGTRLSRYLSADWFVKSAAQREKNGDRDGAIRAMEDALNVVPDHPTANELRTRLLK